MKRSILVLSIFVLTIAPLLGKNKDNSNAYQVGTYLSASAVEDATFTDNIYCGTGGFGGTTCAGSAEFNSVGVYRIGVPDGVWQIESFREAKDSTVRQFGLTPLHFRDESNPLAGLKSGDKVMFRIDTGKNGLFRSATFIYVPNPANPGKETKFIATFFPFVVAAVAQKPTDNVKAMCESRKLSPELQKQYCSQ